MLPIALALMAKGVYDKTTNDSRAAAEHEEDRQFAKMKQERQARAWQDEDNLKASMRMAAAPASVDPNMVKAEEQDNRDVGQPGEPAPTQQGFRVNGQVLGSMAEAQKAADTHNAPGAVNARMSSALLQAGRPVEAQQLRSGARQEQVADLQADQLKQAAERDKKLREVGGLIKKGWPAVAEVYARYDDGMNAKVEPDGKGGATVIGIDGSGKEVSRTKYASLPDFFADVVAEFDPTKWIGMHEKKTERAESERRWNAEMDLRTKSEARRAAHDDRIAGIAERKSAASDPLSKLPPAVKLRAEGLRTEISQLNQAITKAQADGSWQPGSPGAKELATRKAALGLQLNQVLAPYMKGDGGVGDDALGLFGDEPPAKPSPGAAASPAPAPTAGAPAAAPAQPSAIASMASAIQQNRREASQQGAEYQQLQRRAQEAMSGGAALTQQERALARQYGIAT